MSPQTHRSIIVQQRRSVETEPSPQDPQATGYVVVMDDREEEEELISLLILREERRRDIAGLIPGRHGKGEAA